MEGQVKSIQKQQTTIRKPIECAPEASSGGREWAEMTGGFHLVTKVTVLYMTSLLKNCSA